MTKNILISVIAAAFLFSGCSEQSKKEEHAVKAEQKTEKSVMEKATESVKESANAVAEKTSDMTQKAVEATKDTASKAAEASSDMAQKATEAASNAVESTKEAAKDVAKGAKEVAKKAVEGTKEAAKEVVEKTKEGIAAAGAAVTKAVSGEKPAANGKEVFTKCAGCHGAKAEKKALGKSQVIAGWPADKIEKALHGYKDGSYGGAMKGLMQGQVKNLSDAEIKAVAEYISKL